MSVSPQTNLAAANGRIGLLAQRGSTADGPELWNADHTDAAALNPEPHLPQFSCSGPKGFRVVANVKIWAGPKETFKAPPESECFLPAAAMCASHINIVYVSAEFSGKKQKKKQTGMGGQKHCLAQGFFVVVAFSVEYKYCRKGNKRKCSTT